jgi:PAS domain S-box-containing protein
VLPWLELNDEKVRQVEIVDNEKRARALKVTMKRHQLDSSIYTSIILRDVTEAAELEKELTELKDMEIKYRHALECLFDGVIITDQEGKIIYINKAQERIDNVTKSDVHNKNAKEFFNLDDERSVLMQALITKKDTPEQHQYYINMVGQAVNIVTYGYPLRVDDKVIGAVAVCRDTTKVKDFAEKVLSVYHQPDDQAAKPAAVKGKQKKVKYYTFDDLIGNNAAFKEAIRWAQVAAETDSSVLIYGVTGTGKELFAQSIHSHSNRKNAPFIGINCAALPESLLDACPGVDVYLVLSAAANRKDMVETVNRYSQINITNLIFTKLDETNSYGNILNIINEYEQGVAYITTGQNVPNDIEAPAPEKIAKLILQGRDYLGGSKEETVSLFTH